MFILPQLKKSISRLLKNPLLQWINKMWYIHAMEYYSAPKRNEAQTQATTQMNLKNVMLIDVNQ